MDETIDLSTVSTRFVEGGAPMPGIVLVASGGAAAYGVALVASEPVEIGRGDVLGFTLADASVSRQHVRVQFEGACWTVSDLGSRNGTSLDGTRITGTVHGGARHVLRAGSSLFVLLPDVRKHSLGTVQADGERVIGPGLASALEEVRSAARHGDPLHLTGESGAGKELASRVYHEATGRPNGPLVAVNCATIPEGLAERLLFGARKGAFSGATADTEGYIQAASGGTLFLDELGELDLGVQGKLLRVLETSEVTPLGATRPQRVDIRICSATLVDLRARVEARRFREDLYFRIGRPHVMLPPLRDRPEEIPHLVLRAAAGVDGQLAVAGSLFEECLLRPWPGNVRELLAAVREAARVAKGRGATTVDRTCLAETAGRPFGSAAESSARSAAASASALPADAAIVPLAGREPTREELVAVLRRAGGNVSSAARALGLHRTQLRRYLARHELDAKSFAIDAAGPTESED